MFDYISGKVAHRDQDFLVIDVGGIGYQIMTDGFTLNAVQTGETATIYTFLKVSADDIRLYGFHQKEQRSMFEKLTSVSGVGPKAGISILSALRVNDIAAAIIANDDKAFTIAPGIGKKTSQRLILELKEKVDFSEAIGSDADAAAFCGGTDAAADACAALVGLGYNRQEAMAAISAVKSLGDTAEELVALALKRMG